MFLPTQKRQVPFSCLLFTLFFFLSLLREIESQSCTFLFSTSYPPFYPNFLYSPSVVGFFSIFFCSLFRHSSFFELHAPVCKKCCFSVCLILHMYEGNQLESQLWGSSKHSSVWLQVIYLAWGFNCGFHECRQACKQCTHAPSNALCPFLCCTLIFSVKIIPETQ